MRYGERCMSTPVPSPWWTWQPSLGSAGCGQVAEAEGPHCVCTGSSGSTSPSPKHTHTFTKTQFVQRTCWRNLSNSISKKSEWRDKAVRWLQHWNWEHSLVVHLPLSLSIYPDLAKVWTAHKNTRPENHIVTLDHLCCFPTKNGV